MSVIGRLDDQVDRALISPLARNGRTQTDRGQESHVAENVSRSEKGSRRSRESAQRDEEAMHQEELPVWML